MRALLVHVLSVSIGILTACLLTGCGDAPPDYVKDLVTVSGTVTMDGEPVEGAIVTFLAQQGANRASNAVSDAQGKYTMATTAAGEGVLPGTYNVVISKFTMPDGTPVPPDTPPMDVGAEEQLPNRYSSFAEPTLTAEVPAGGGTVDFELKSK